MNVQNPISKHPGSYLNALCVRYTILLSELISWEALCEPIQSWLRRRKAIKWRWVSLDDVKTLTRNRKCFHTFLISGPSSLVTGAVV